MIALALTVCASAAFADNFGTYADQQGMSCALTNFAPYPNRTQAFVIHKLNAGSTGAQLGIVDTSGPSNLFLGYLTDKLIGGPLNNLSIGYPGCLGGDVLIMTLEWLVLPGGQYTCANNVQIVAATNPPAGYEGHIVNVLCDYTYEVASGGTLWVGPSAGDCVPPTGCEPVPVAETTWGGIKALYR
jgi:hypothetical protein